MITRSVARALREAASSEPESAVVSRPTTIELVPGIDEEITQIVEEFWGQTQALAEQNAHLHWQQRVQANSQNVALMDVHANAEDGVNRLAEFQLETNAQMRRVMEQTRTAMQEQLQALARMQSEHGRQLHDSLEEPIQRVFLEAVAARDLALQQANEARRVEASMTDAMNALHSSLSEQIRAQQVADTPSDGRVIEDAIHERWLKLERELEPHLQQLATDAVAERLVEVERRLQTKGLVSARVKSEVDKSVAESEERVEARMQLALQAHRESARHEMKQEVEAQSNETIRAHVDDAEKRMEATMQRALNAHRESMRREMKKEVEAYSSATLRVELQAQEDKQDQSQPNLTSRLDLLSARLDALEAPRVVPEIKESTRAATPNGSIAGQEKTLSDSLQLETLGTAIHEAAQKIKAVVDLYEKNSAERRRHEQFHNRLVDDMKKLQLPAHGNGTNKAGRIAAFVARLQDDVRQRPEAAAAMHENKRRHKAQ
jgi:hypothetical protein